MDVLTASPIAVSLRPEGLEDDQLTRIRAALDASPVVESSDSAAVQVVIGGPSISLLEEVRAVTPVIIVAGSVDRGNTSELLAAGAAGVVAESDVSEGLVPAVIAVAAGLVAVSRSGAQGVQRPLLTGRETEILALVVMGLTNGDIARRLFLAESTVKYHLLGVYRKLGVRTRKEATAVVLDPRNGLAQGIVGVTASSRARRGYSRPTLE